MKVLFVGFKYDYGIPSRGESLEINSFYPAIKKNSEECHAFWLEDNGYLEKNDLLQTKIINHAEKINPDLIFFILMNNEIKKETIITLSSKYNTLNWFCDDQWRFESFSKNVAKYLSYTVTVDKYSISKYLNLGIKPLLSQWATFDYTTNVDFLKVKYEFDVTFVGSKNLSRDWIVKELLKHGIKVKCFGSGWGNGKITYEKMKECFLNSKINLNLSNSAPKDINFFKFVFKSFFINIFSSSLSLKKRIDYFRFLKSHIFTNKKIEQIKARNFEIPGCGGFQISKFALGIDDYYTNGKDIIFFSDIDELVILIKYYLENDKERELIRTSGYKRTSNHTYEKRISELFNKIELLEENKI